MIPFIIFVQVLLVMICTAFYTLLERKILAYLQTRKGPNKPSALGLLVPFGDALKLITKENNKPSNGNMALFIAIPVLLILIPFILWGVYPSYCEITSFKYSCL